MVDRILGQFSHARLCYAVNLDWCIATALPSEIQGSVMVVTICMVQAFFVISNDSLL